MNKPDQQALMMDYLYGEMTDEQRREYELWLERHPEVQQEIEELQASRNWLADVETVIPQPLVVNLAPKRTLDLKWLYRVGAAAAVVLALWLSNFQIKGEEGGFTLSFGNPKSIDSHEIEQPVDRSVEEMEAWKMLLASNQNVLEQKMMAMDSTWQNQFTKLENRQQQQWAQVNRTQTQQVQRIKQEFTEDELPRLANLMQQLQQDQLEELRLLLTEFWTSWQDTRQTDLQFIDVQMTNMLQNVERNQQESEARVVNYIENVAGR